MRLVQLIHLKVEIFFSIGIEKCAHGFWLCKTGTCIKKDDLCNEHRNCPDGSDEDVNFCHSYVCGLNKFRCRTGECILKSEVKINFPIFSYFCLLEIYF